MNGRERYFKIINFEKQRAYRSRGPLVRGRTIFAGGSWDAGSNPPVAASGFFLSFIVFLPFGFLLFVLTADPFSFARFLQKRISSIVNASYSVYSQH